MKIQRLLLNAVVVRATEIPLSVSEDHEHKQFYLIKFIDEGIGFEQLNADRIFNVFIRLHVMQNTVNWRWFVNCSKSSGKPSWHYRSRKHSGSSGYFQSLSSSLKN
jgi:hypothetical protein